MTDRDLDDLTRHDILPETQPLPRRQASAVVALWIGVLALLAGGVFGAVFLAGEDEGTPEQAVQRLFDAIADEDVLGVLAALPPSERDPLRDNLPDIADELERLGILSDDFDLGKVRGVDLGFENMRFTTTSLADGVAAVRITAGNASYRVVPRELPLGDFVTDLIGDELPSKAQTGSEPINADPSDDTIVAVREGDRWYVSLNYTIAEAARVSSGRPVPKFGNELQPKGESSPEGAVESLLRAGLALDVQRVIELLPPDEGRALRDYSPLFLPEAKEGLAQLDFRAEVRSLELAANRDGERATVDLESIDVTFTAEGESGGFAFDGKCVTVSGPDVPPGEGRLCPEDAEGPQALTGFASRVPAQGLVAVQRGGAWYVSPTRTVLESILGTLKAVQRSDLESLRDFFTGMATEEEYRLEDKGDIGPPVETVETVPLAPT